MTIRLLEEKTIAKIAAGEGIEHPASVVKELLENSIDSGARRIEVEVKDGGSALIRVTDDGCGMSRDEASLALKRHSTSKIKSAEDLFSISTLGFRGEALPSIAAVSRLELLTGRNGSGSRLYVEGAETRETGDAGCPGGTTVRVLDLFFNTPARRKFLKSASTETYHISDVVSKYVLAYPSISFKLISNGKQLAFSSGDGSRLNAFASVYGSDMAGSAVKVEFSSGYADVSGHAVRPSVTRIDRRSQAFFVNGRYVKNILLSRSLSDAYRTLIPSDRFPIAALFISVEPALVDVNVHPTKREVRFEKTNEVMKSVREAVGMALGSGGQALGSRLQGEEKWKPEAASVFFENFSSAPEIEMIEPEKQIDGINAFQILNSYIVTLDGDGFTLIDQHAAHERVVFDRLASLPDDPARQGLLVPENIELSATDSDVLRDNMEVLRGLGFGIEDFGKNSFVLREVPAELVGSSAGDVVSDIVSELKSSDRPVSVEARREKVMKLIACHSAVRAGDPMTHDEIASLVKQLRATANPLTCPHGRPTMAKFTRADLDRLFKRS